MPHSFETEAREFCRILELDASESGPPEEYARLCLHSLLRLYAAGLELPPDICSPYSITTEITKDQWDTIFRSLGKKLPLDFYWTAFDPVGNSDPPEPTVGSLCDDLADIWRDLKAGLVDLDENGKATHDAVIQHWRFLFAAHISDHANGAITALHHASNLSPHQRM